MQNNGTLRESERKYDLLNGIQKKIHNEKQEARKEQKSGKKLLEMARKKYELLHGIRNSTQPKSNSERENICGETHIIYGRINVFRIQA